MRRIVLAAILLLPLAPLAAQAMKPGQWEVIARVTNAVLPGAPPQMIEKMKTTPRTASRCISAAEAAKGPQELMKAAPSCKVTHSTTTGTRIETSLSCADPKGTGSALIAASGTFGPTSFTITSHAVINQAKGPPAVIDATNSGRWTGTCTK